MDIYTFAMDNEGCAWLEPIDAKSWRGKTYSVTEMEPINQKLIRFRVESKLGNSKGTEDVFAEVGLTHKGVISVA